MRIGELARETGTTTRALRFYEEQGLLTADRSANGYRSYPASARTRVANIRYLLDAGLTIEDVQQFHACLDGDLPNNPPDAAALAVGRRRLDVLDGRIAALVQVRDHLAAQLNQKYGEAVAVRL